MPIPIHNAAVLKATALVCLLSSGLAVTHAFTVSTNPLALTRSTIQGPPRLTARTQLFMAYIPPEQSDQSTAVKTKKPLLPKVGDMVRYYDIDGGKQDGQVLVGKISYITTKLGKDNKRWTVELTELEDIGDGYYAEYPSRKRLAKKTTRDLAHVAPVMASFVRAENAFKIPLNKNGSVQVRAPQYDLDEYQGPWAASEEINQDVLTTDGIRYAELKGQLLRNAAIAGAVGTVLVDLTKGTEDAIIYAAGAIASVAYLFFLSIKTDTLGSQDSKLGKGVSNVRYLMPILVIIGVALYNKSRGDDNPIQNDDPFDTVTPEQYAAAIIGFLTYRIPLFLTQLMEGLKDDAGKGIALPGSAGVAMQLAQQSQSDASAATGSVLTEGLLTPVLVVSGPQATGRSKLVNQLIDTGNGRFVRPKRIDRISDGVTFERLQTRGEILTSDGRYGITKEGILTATKGAETESVVVVDADVELAKKLTKMSGARLIGVWVGLNSVAEFENRVEAMIDGGEMEIPEDETKESVIRARIREIVQEIEFGISSGIFEFTILNENPEESIRELRDAANYSFK
jgi:guanylate kinase